MYTMKIFNGDMCFVKFNIDFKNKTIDIIEKYQDTLLDAMFHDDFSYNRMLSFIKSRMKNDINDRNLIDTINITELKLFDDKIKMTILN